MAEKTLSYLLVLCWVVLGSSASVIVLSPEAEMDTQDSGSNGDTFPMQTLRNMTDEELRIHKAKLAKRVTETLKQVKQLDNSAIEKAVHVNFLNTLYLMANGTAVTGNNISRAAGTVIRGFVQDQLNLASIAAYFPRLIFLDGPTQFIETLRLIRTNQIRVPTDLDSAIDTLINFAGQVRTSQISANVGTPFLSIFPNIFRGAELLGTEVLYSVFQWLAPINPADISAPAVEGLWNRWDNKPSTTPKYDYDKRFRN